MRLVRGPASFGLLALSCALVATACYDLPDVDPGECGNKVVDPGEDCDTFSAFGTADEPDGVCADNTDAERACRYTCESDACPTGWQCGDDGICRQPSGRFEAPRSWHMPADQFAIGDVDGDGRMDMVGNDDHAITVRFGAGGGDFSDELEYTIRTPVGPVTYGHIGEDDLLDAVVPIDDGLFVLRGDPARTFLPVTYAPFSTGSAEATFVLAEIGGDAAVFSELLLISPALQVVAFLDCTCPNWPECDECTEPLPDPERDLVSNIPVADIDLDGADPRDEFVLLYPGGDALFVYGSTGFPSEDAQGGNIQVVHLYDLALPGGWTVRDGAIFAQVDGTGGLDLIVGIQDGEDAKLAVAYNNGGVLTTPVEFPLFDIVDSGMTLSFLPLAVGDYDKDGFDDYVLPYGMVLAVPQGGPVQGVPPESIAPLTAADPDFWGDAAMGDFNGDGALDFAVARFDPSIQLPLDGVDIYVNAGAGFPNRFRLDSSLPPRMGDVRTFAVGDFDGDLISDLAFVGHSLVGGGDVVSVVFGSVSAGFGDAEDMGRLPRIDQAFPVNLPLSASGFDSIQDLFLLTAETVGDTEEVRHGVALMLGDSSRRMVSPLVLSAGLLAEGPPSGQHVPMRAVIGDFNEDERRDIIAIAMGPEFDNWESPATVDEAGPQVASAWFLPAGETEGSVAASFSDPKQRPHARPIPNAEFDLRCSTWTAVDLHQSSGGGTAHSGDELIGLDDISTCQGGEVGDGKPNLVEIEIFPLPAEVASGACEEQPICFRDLALTSDDDDELSYPIDVGSGDLDSNGTLDAAVLFRGDRAAQDGGAGTDPFDYGAGVGILWNDAGRLASDGYEVINTFDQPIGLASISLDANESRDLVILTVGGVYAAEFDGDTGRFESLATPLLPMVVGHLIATGDLNGDGVEDIAVVHGDTVDVFLAIPEAPLGNPPVTGDDPMGSGGSQ